MTDARDKPLMRSLGEFFGHIVKGIKTDPARERTRKVVKKEVEEDDRGDVVLRRTTIEEIEFKGEAPAPDDTDDTREESG